MFILVIFLIGWYDVIWLVVLCWDSDLVRVMMVMFVLL